MRTSPPVRRALATGVLALACLSAGAETLILKMASYVPSNSPWDLGLKRLAAEFDRISGGTVRLTFPQSARISNETDIIQKMRLGVDGALLTAMGIAELYPDSLALFMPSLIHDEAEFDVVLQAIEPLIRSKLGDRYEFLVIAKAGWVRYFSKRPIVYPEDLAGIRMSVSPSDEKVQSLLQSAGARTVKGDMTAFILQLNANALDAFYLSPVFTASLWSQLKGKITYISPFKVSPFIGSIVFTKKSWERVPAELRPKLIEAAKAIARRMTEEGDRLEEEAVAAMKRDGLKEPPYPADADARWAAVYSERREGMIATMFSKEILDTIDAALARARGGK